MSEVSNPILGYADSYRLMQRGGAKTIDIWSIITDLERNMAPLMGAVQSELAALREDLDKARKDRETLLKLHVHLRARRSYWISEETKARRELAAAEQRNSDLRVLLLRTESSVHYHLRDVESRIPTTDHKQLYRDKVLDLQTISSEIVAALKPTESGASE